MKFRFSVLFLALALSFPAAAKAAETYTLDPGHTEIVWQAGHFGFSSPTGKFAGATGKVMLDEAAPAKSSVEVTINTAALFTGNEKFDAHLKSADFFNVEKFPSASFKSENVTLTGEKTATVEGMLTILGISKPVTLEVTLNKLDVNPLNSRKTAGFSAKTTIRRSEFGINYGLPGIPDEVTIAIQAEASPEEAAPKAAK